MSFGAVAASVAGAAVGGLLNDKGGGQQQTQSRDPWSAVQPWLRNNIDLGQQLQDYYQNTPFNPIQQTSYQNLLGDIDAFRSGMAPGLMGMANRLMGSNYQRAPAGTELGAANPYPPGTFSTRPMLASNANMPSGLLGGAMGAASRMQPMNRDQGWQGSVPQESVSAPSGVLPMAMGNNVFSVNPGQSYGQLAWDALNPYTNGGIKPLPVAKPASDDKANKDYEDFWRWNLGG